MQSIYLAGGCFWGIEEYFSRIKGVVSTKVGYANSDTINPTYEQICEHTVKAIETVYIEFDQNIVGLKELLDSFFKVVDPTSIDKQGGDIGYQYKSGIYYSDEKLLPLIEERLKEEQTKYDKPIVTEVLPIKNFFDAEEYHQNYLKKNPNGYCHIKFN